jgi:hypothetical protein
MCTVCSRVPACAAWRGDRLWRGHRARAWAHHALVVPRAALRIQTGVRGFLARRARDRLLRRHAGATHLQRLWRGRAARAAVAVLRALRSRYRAIVTLQCFARCVVARRVAALRRKRRYEARVEGPAAGVVTRFLRRCRARRTFRALVTRHVSAVKVQRWYRRRRAALAWLPLARARAAAVLVAFGRRVVARRRGRFAAAVKRGARVTAAFVLQRWWRGCACRRSVRPQMEVWRVQRVRKQLDAWRMLILSLEANVKDVQADIKGQVCVSVCV